jgi:transcriptional regulator
MYIPDAFAVTDRDVVRDFIDRHSFATLVSVFDGEPFATHLPLLLDRANNQLLGHVARANPHARGFDGKTPSLAIFTGPHAYVSPGLYVNLPAVPTWNYTAVHVVGCPAVIDDERRIDDLLASLIHKYESSRDQRWSGEMPDDYRRKMVRGIIAFEMPMTRVEGKFKLSQNRPEADRENVVRHLEDRDVAALMRANRSR